MSVCMAVGVRWHGPRQKARLAFHMGLFQFFMPALGWAVGTQVAGVLQSFGKYVAAALVFAIGAKMLYEALRSHPGVVAEHAAEWETEHILHRKQRDPTRGWSLVALSLATSIDALVVGFSLGLRDEGIWGACVIIGIVAAVMALAGVAIGKRAGKALGKPAEAIGAIILMALGVSFVLL